MAAQSASENLSRYEGARGAGPWDTPQSKTRASTTSAPSEAANARKLWRLGHVILAILTLAVALAAAANQIIYNHLNYELNLRQATARAGNAPKSGPPETPVQTRTPTPDPQATANENFKRAMAAETDSVHPNFGLASTLFASAAVFGSAQAPARLASMYRAGRGVPNDSVQAVVWLAVGTAENDPIALSELDVWAGTSTKVRPEDAESCKTLALKVAADDARPGGELTKNFLNTCFPNDDVHYLLTQQEKAPPQTKKPHTKHKLDHSSPSWRYDPAYRAKYFNRKTLEPLIGLF